MNSESPPTKKSEEMSILYLVIAQTLENLFIQVTNCWLTTAETFSSSKGIFINLTHLKLNISSIEKESETSVVLREKCPLKYDKGLVLQKLSGFKSASHGDMPFNHASLSMSSNEEDASETSPKSRDSIDERDEINSEKNESKL